MAVISFSIIYIIRRAMLRYIFFAQEKRFNSCTDLLIMLDIFNFVIDMPKTSYHINAIKVVAF